MSDRRTSDPVFVAIAHLYGDQEAGITSRQYLVLRSKGFLSLASGKTTSITADTQIGITGPSVSIASESDQGRLELSASLWEGGEKA